MKSTWRWFGPNDPISLEQVRQAGATGVVTALHHIAPGQPWPMADIEKRKAVVEASGLTWDVCESIWMPDEIKARGAAAVAEIDAWKESLANLGKAGVKMVCYNFMPVLDWTRTELYSDISIAGQALRFDEVDFAVYDICILKRPNAEADFEDYVVTQARAKFAEMTAEECEALEGNIIAGLPGAAETLDRAVLLERIAMFDGLTPDDVRQNLKEFLQAVVPVAEEYGVKLGVHPDDPPFPLFGLPRVVSTADDLQFLIDAAPSEMNGLTLCTGSLGARADNDLVAMAKRFGPKINFAHLRNVQLEGGLSFHEAEHLGGSVDMVGVVKAILDEEESRGGDAAEIPMRPDHGHLLSFEKNMQTNPGYSYLGRLKGLSELHGVIAAFSANRTNLG